ncbi:alpha/beta hydrolase [Aeromicrobium sp. A1-2]|uniref:alpha/beta hydrolase n=1 Tax=Aeromicrobium sp. A1-2 TaxID=2107713 RepID=UPI0013C36BCB|nr:alpha/beta hydrolase [Aeromicrobium sp. A1-2]
MSGPRLDHHTALENPRAIVLLLHGGQQQSTDPVENKHASWWRMALMARSLRGFAKRHDIALSLLQYGQRGWNSETQPAPVVDAMWALDQLSGSHDVPVLLVGHSMGGRTACRVADHPAVVGVVGLAPWLPPGEPNRSTARRHLRILHGTADRWTSAAASRDYVERSRSIATSATWTSLPGAGHFMFRRSSAWRRFVEDSLTDILDTATSHEGAPNKGLA